MPLPETSKAEKQRLQKCLQNDTDGRIPNLIAQISKRGREYEQSIRIDYLTGLNNRYEEWIKTYPVKLLIIDGDELKFESNAQDFKKITEQIDSVLYGLF